MIHESLKKNKITGINLNIWEMSQNTTTPWILCRVWLFYRGDGLNTETYKIKSLITQNLLQDLYNSSYKISLYLTTR